MHDQLGKVFLGVLSFLCGSYGLWELALAYNAESFEEWAGKAGLGAGSLTLCALFAICSYRLVGGIIVTLQ